MKVLVTGSAGFIGSHVSMALLKRGDEVVGIDNINDYYDVALKQARLAPLASHPGYTHLPIDIADRRAVEACFDTHRPTRVVHLAAQPGVRYAAVNPHAYVSSNVTGFLHVLEGCRHHGVEQLVFASTSSVYGANRCLPYGEDQPTEHPLTLYAATKKADEMMAHAYAHLYDIPCTGLRFFTVYGPWGRPDMAPMIFARAICAGKLIPLFNGGSHRRSFTYVDDVVVRVIAVLDRRAKATANWDSLKPDPGTSFAPFLIYNVGNPCPVGLNDFVYLLAQALGKKARINNLPRQRGDVEDTAADDRELRKFVGDIPYVPIQAGIQFFADWYLRNYREFEA